MNDRDDEPVIAAGVVWGWLAATAVIGAGYIWGMILLIGAMGK